MFDLLIDFINFPYYFVFLHSTYFDNFPKKQKKQILISVLRSRCVEDQRASNAYFYPTSSDWVTCAR